MNRSWLRVLIVALMIAVASSAVTAATSTTTKSKPVVKSSSKTASKSCKSTKPTKSTSSKKDPKSTTQTAKSKAQAAKPKALPKLVDFSAEWCRPCKMQKPIIDELAKEYKGKINVEFVDIDKNKAMADKYKIEAIPVQVFLDAKGKEVYRHVGFMPKEDIVSQLKDMGVK